MSTFALIGYRPHISHKVGESKPALFFLLVAVSVLDVGCGVVVDTNLLGTSLSLHPSSLQTTSKQAKRF
jgi:hypothetical protein